MARFDDCLAVTLQYEGGYVNNPADHGGATNKGITQATYDRFRIANGLPVQSVKLIATPEIAAIYGPNYWLPPRCSELAIPLDLCVFDTSVNSGPVRAVRLLQLAVGVSEDGIFGSGTMAAVNALPVLVVCAQFLDQREQFCRDIAADNPSQAVFLDGWLARVDKLRAICGLPVGG